MPPLPAPLATGTDGKATVDGSLKYAEADANKGKQPKVIAGAYSNSHVYTDSYCNCDSHANSDLKSNAYADPMHGQMFTDAKTASDSSPKANSMTSLK